MLCINIGSVQLKVTNPSMTKTATRPATRISPFFHISRVLDFYLGHHLLQNTLQFSNPSCTWVRPCDQVLSTRIVLGWIVFRPPNVYAEVLTLRWLCWETGSLKKKLRLNEIFGMGSDPICWYPFKKRRQFEVQGEDSRLQVKERGLDRAFPPCQHRDFGLRHPKLCDNKFLSLSCPVCGPLLRQSQETPTSSLRFPPRCVLMEDFPLFLELVPVILYQPLVWQSHANQVIHQTSLPLLAPLQLEEPYN